jgi:protein-disulfide isomerase
MKKRHLGLLFATLSLALVFILLRATRHSLPENAASGAAASTQVSSPSSDPPNSSSPATESSSSQASDPHSTARADPQYTLDTVLKPPKGSQVAIVVFEDLECPSCSRAAPAVKQAGKTYRIPVVRHDFPLPMHPWSYQAAVYARFFDTTSKDLGNEFRDYIFGNQLGVNLQTLRSYAEKFAAAHRMSLPYIVDPNGKLAAQVDADRDLGKALNLRHTPTIYIVSSRNPKKPYVEVTEPATELYSTIDAVMKN